MLYREALKAIGRASMSTCDTVITETYCDYFRDDGATRVIDAYGFVGADDVNSAYFTLANQDMEQYACLMMDLWCRLEFEGEAYL